jgi:hypothetical protein
MVRYRTMAELKPYTLIDSWTTAYGISGDVTFGGYQSTLTSSDTLGLCRYTSHGCVLILHDKLRTHPVIAHAVLWHEFAHAAAYYEHDHQCQEHNSEWRKWLWKRPLLALIDTFAPSPSLL